MDERDIDEAAELVGTAKELFKAFESQLGEVMANQRLASKEANEALAETHKTLSGLLQHARNAGEIARSAQEELRRGWQLHVAENSKAAGSEMARKFGEDIARGLEKRLAQLAEEVEIATRRLAWKGIVVWALGLALGIPLTVELGIQSFMPRVEDLSIPGLTGAQTQGVLSRITLCWPEQKDARDPHVCVLTDDPPHVTRDRYNEPAVVARGM